VAFPRSARPNDIDDGRDRMSNKTPEEEKVREERERREQQREREERQEDARLDDENR
jgi:hypothetical protein